MAIKLVPFFWVIVHDPGGRETRCLMFSYLYLNYLNALTEQNKIILVITAI